MKLVVLFSLFLGLWGANSWAAKNRPVEDSARRAQLRAVESAGVSVKEAQVVLPPY